MGFSDNTASKLAVHKDKLLTASFAGIFVVLLGANWIEYRFLKVTYNPSYYELIETLKLTHHNLFY